MSKPLTARESEILQAYRVLKNKQAVADKLGITRSSVRTALDRVKHKLPPEQHPDTPIGNLTGKQTVQYDGEGNVVQSWVRFHPDAESWETILTSLEERAEGKAPKVAKCKARKTNGKAVLVKVADPHLGLYCWAKETGNRYDLQYGVDLHLAAFERLIEQAGDDNDEIILAFLGDLLHFDSNKAVTPKSGHSLDASGRYAEILDAATHMMCTMIERAAKHGKKVVVKCVSGNHDIVSGLVMKRILRAYYKDVKQIEVCPDETKQVYHVYGNTLMGFAHGDTEKPDRLKDGMTLHPKWSACRYHHIYVGHTHQKAIKEFSNCIVETVPTLTGLNAYAKDHMYGSRRQMTASIFDKKYGEIGSLSVAADWLEK